jgi:hypothetical protein
MATMTISEAYYVCDIICAELRDESRRHHPFSALKGYDVFQICNAYMLVVANEFLLLTGRNDFEKKFGEGVKLYESIISGIPLNFVADEQVDMLGADSAFLWDDPRFRSQETPSSFAEYCKHLGADDPLYWQKAYARLELEYTSASPRGNDTQSPECNLDDPGVRNHFQRVVSASRDTIIANSSHIGDCSLLPYQKKTILYATRWLMDHYEGCDRPIAGLARFFTHVARDWHQIEPADKDTIAQLNKCDSFPDWALPLKLK